MIQQLELIRCKREQILVDVDSSLEHVFFPDSGVISAVAVYSDGRVIETATIGREGCTNVQAALGAKRSSVRLLVQIPGSAQKMPRATFMRAIGTMPPRRRATCSISLLRRAGRKTRAGRSSSRPCWPTSRGFPAIASVFPLKHDLFGKPASTFRIMLWRIIRFPDNAS